MVRSAVEHKDGELVTAEPGDDGGVARFVSEVVVDGFEAVQIDEENRGRPMVQESGDTLSKGFSGVRLLRETPWLAIDRSRLRNEYTRESRAARCP
jgi:hypothetical protein